MTAVVRIPFNGDEILAVEISGKPQVILKHAVESIGLDYSAQLTKLKSRSWAVMGHCPTTGPDGKTYNMVTIDVRGFLMLLATVDERRVAEGVRDKLIRYQSEVADVVEAYFTRGGAVNPRATTDQLADIIGRTKAQMEILKLAEGLVDAAWLEAKARHAVARALGEEPEVDPTDRPLTVGEYLHDRGLTGAALRSASTKFGRHLKARYRAVRGCEPSTVERFVDNALRPVAGYSEADRPMFDAVWNEFYGGDR